MHAPSTPAPPLVLEGGVGGAPISISYSSADFAKDVAERLEAAQKALAFEHEQVLALLDKRTNNKHEVSRTSDGTGSSSNQLCQQRPPQQNFLLPHPAVRAMRSLGEASSRRTSTTSCQSFAAWGDHVMPPAPKNSALAEGSIGNRSTASPDSSATVNLIIDAKKSGKHGGRHWEMRAIWKDTHIRDTNASKGSGRVAEVESRTSFTSRSILLGHCIMHPNSYKRAMWDLLTMAMILYDVLTIPFGLIEPEQSQAMLVMVWVSRLFWSFDVWMSFSSGFIHKDGHVELHPYNIAKKYMQTWFFFDVVVVLIDWMELTTDGLGWVRNARVFRFLRMLRLFRLAKANAIIALLAEKFVSEEMIASVQVFKLLVMMLIVGHSFACVWFAISKGASSRPSWLETYGFLHETVETQYLISLRWALSQFSGGMDEVTPQNFWEHFYSAVISLMAWWAGAAILSSMTSHMTQIYTLRNHQSQQMSALKRYLQTQKASRSLCKRIIRNAQYTLNMRKMEVDSTAVLMRELVSTPLMTELHFEMYYPYLSLHPFFNQLVKDNKHVVRKVCHAAIFLSVNVVGDAIFHAGQVAENMVVPSAGILEYDWGLTDSHEVAIGDWLSEHVLWTEWAHHGTLIVVENTRCLFLNAEAFGKIASHFEFENFDPRRYAMNFLTALNNMAPEEMSDLPIKGAVRATLAETRGMSLTAGRASAMIQVQRTRFSSLLLKIQHVFSGKGRSQSRTSTLSAVPSETNGCKNSSIGRVSDSSIGSNNQDE